ncbi:MAG: DNA polymerase IV [Intestinimonas sp.]|nr:DNA polymerase IV [Intestinimonas sp.]
MDRTILHCDMNGFFASVELLRYPELRKVPVAVCGDPDSRHGIILAKNEPARHFGIQTAETIWQARRKCPELVLLPAHHEEYVRYSRLAAAVYERYTDLVEPFSIDESWLDVTGSLHLFGNSGRAIADRLRADIRNELGLTISVGVSFNKIFSKLGSDLKKPDATTVIDRMHFKEIVWPLPVMDLLFVGRASAKALTRYGVRTIGGLVHFGREPLVRLLGRQGGQLYDYAAGLECSPVDPLSAASPPKSVGNGMTFRRDLVGMDEIRAGVVPLADSVAMRLRRCGRRCTTIQVSIRAPDFRDICRQKRLEVPTCISTELAQAAMDLISAAWRPNAPIRALTVTAQNLVSAEDTSEQLDLFTASRAPAREKRERLERTVDAIRHKFGTHSIGSPYQY